MTQITVKTDGIGDTFVSGYNKYLKDGLVAKMHLEQFIDNYESCFGEQPTPEQLDNAFKFVSMFFGEVSEIYPTSRYARAVSELSWMLGSDAVETAENLANVAQPSKMF